MSSELAHAPPCGGDCTGDGGRSVTYGDLGMNARISSVGVHFGGRHG